MQVPGAPNKLCTLAVTIGSVRDEAGKEHTEVTGSCRELGSMHAGAGAGSGSGGSRSSREGERLDYLRAVVAFCRELRLYAQA